MKNKKLIIILMITVFLYFFAGCGKKTDSGEKKDSVKKVESKENPEQKKDKDKKKGGKDSKVDDEQLKQIKERLKSRGIDPDSAQGKRIIEMIKQRGMGMGREREGGKSTPLVEIEKVTTHNLKSFIILNGKVEPERSVKIYSRLSAYVKEIKVEEDQFVKKGTVIALLDDTEIKIQYRQAENQLKQAKLTLEDEENKFNRSEKLKKEDLISEEDYQTAKSNFNNAKIEHENKMENFKDLQLQLEYTKIRAPIEGYIVERLIDVGSKVNANEEVYSIEDFSPLLIKLYVPAADAINLKKGMNVEIRSDLFLSRIFKGDVKLINPRIDAESGTIKVTVEVDVSKNLLKPGMFVEAKILISKDEDKLAIPSKCLIHKKGESFVYKFEMGKVSLTKIETGITYDDRIEVKGGLKIGEAIVIVGVEDLKDGMRVRVKR